jgi:hypothetical protein
MFAEKLEAPFWNVSWGTEKNCAETYSGELPYSLRFEHRKYLLLDRSANFLTKKLGPSLWISINGSSVNRINDFWKQENGSLNMGFPVPEFVSFQRTQQSNDLPPITWRGYRSCFRNVVFSICLQIRTIDKSPETQWLWVLYNIVRKLEIPLILILSYNVRTGTYSSV